MQDKRDSNGLTEAEFLSRYNSDIYPKPSLTADILVFRADTGSDTPELLLIRRKGHPCIDQWALPGGFAEKGETIEQTAARELEEETGVTGLSLELVGIYSKPGRDPRGWTVSAAYMAVVKRDNIKPSAGDDAKEVCWAEVSMENDIVCVNTGSDCINSELAFDHYEIITDAMEHMRKHYSK